MRPSRESVWRRAAARFHLTPEEVAMAKAAGFTPTLMDEVATGRRIKRRVHDKLPTRAMPGQIKRVKQEIRKRYAAKVEAKSAAGSSAAQSTAEGAASRNASQATSRSVSTNVSSKDVLHMAKKSKKEEQKMKHRWKLAGRSLSTLPGAHPNGEAAWREPAERPLTNGVTAPRNAASAWPPTLSAATRRRTGALTR